MALTLTRCCCRCRSTSLPPSLTALQDRLLNPLAAILISVSAILVFAEILPQAVCKRYGLQASGEGQLGMMVCSAHRPIDELAGAAS